MLSRARWPGAGAFSRLVASYAGADGPAAERAADAVCCRVCRAVFFVQHAGWNEIEYSKQTCSAAGDGPPAARKTFINSGGRDLTLTIAGESPLRYFDAPPHVTIRAGTQVLATAEPSSDFELTVKIPAAALAASDGMLTIETDQTFVPHERSGSPDRRTLGLRIFRFESVNRLRVFSPGTAASCRPAC